MKFMERVDSMTAGIEVYQIRKCNVRGAWWGEYYFQHRYGPNKEFVANLAVLVLPDGRLLTKEQVNYIRKLLAKQWGLEQSKRGNR